jgi:ankyrin repeat protein
MPFDCTSNKKIDQAVAEEAHSAFGDGYSMKSRSASSSKHQKSNASRYGYDDEPEADYDDGATELYHRIENKDWEGALSRLDASPIEAKTWVSRREPDSDKIRWRLIPVHAVCIFRAPLALLEALVEVYPDGPRMKDDQGMLPVHLACRNGASKGVVMTLLMAFPESIHVRDRKGRVPTHLVQRSSSANKEAVLYSMKQFMQDFDARSKGVGDDGEDITSYRTYDGSSRFTSIGTPSYMSDARLNSVSDPSVKYSPSDPSVKPIPAQANFVPNFVPHKVPTTSYSSDANPWNNLGTHSLATQSIPLQSLAMHSVPLQSLATHSVPLQSLATHSVPLTVQLTVSEVDYENRTLLFRLVLKKEWKTAMERVISNPEEASTWIVTKGFNGNLRFLPIHKACVLNPPGDLIEALLKAYEPGAKDKDQDGWLPIHCACFYGAKKEVIDKLLAANPQGAQSKDEDGRLPLHYACLKRAEQGVVDALLSTFSKGTMSKDEEGRLPLHHACGKGASAGIIDAILNAYPKGAQSKDDQGRLPLHHACRKNASERVIRSLIRVYPRGAQIKDDQDKLPIHYECQHGLAATTVISLLLESFPESINVRNGFGSTPLMEAKSLENNPKIEPMLRILEKAKRDFDSTHSENDVKYLQKMSAMEERIASLELSLGKVALLGREMRVDIVRKNKDPAEVLEKFADNLIELSSAGSKQQKMPLSNSRNVTPIKLVGRGKSKVAQPIN